MTRRCSHCSNNGHNSRTCPNRGGGGVKLFGVRLTDGSIIKKSASMGNLSAHYHSSSSAAASPNHQDSPSSDPVHVSDGYLSDDPAHASCSANRRGDRKKGNETSYGPHLSIIIVGDNLIYNLLVFIDLRRFWDDWFFVLLYCFFFW